MSLIPIGVSVALAAAEGLLNPVVFNIRRIGEIVADVTEAEHHDDETVVTDNPIEQGANVSDNAINMAARVTLHVTFSNSSPQSGGDPSYSVNAYQALLALKNNRAPFDLITGKRSYANMLITRLSAVTDRKSEHSLPIIVECREAILVDTQTVVVPSSTVMKTPSATAPQQNMGAQQLQPAPKFNSSDAEGL